MQKHYDKVPTQGSTNPVKSDGLAQQLTQIGSELDEVKSELQLQIDGLKYEDSTALSLRTSTGKAYFVNATSTHNAGVIMSSTNRNILYAAVVAGRTYHVTMSCPTATVFAVGFTTEPIAVDVEVDVRFSEDYQDGGTNITSHDGYYTATNDGYIAIKIKYADRDIVVVSCVECVEAIQEMESRVAVLETQMNGVEGQLYGKKSIFNYTGAAWKEYSFVKGKEYEITNNGDTAKTVSLWVNTTDESSTQSFNISSGATKTITSVSDANYIRCGGSATIIVKERDCIINSIDAFKKVLSDNYESEYNYKGGNTYEVLYGFKQGGVYEVGIKTTTSGGQMVFYIGTTAYYTWNPFSGEQTIRFCVAEDTSKILMYYGSSFAAGTATITITRVSEELKGIDYQFGIGIDCRYTTPTQEAFVIPTNENRPSGFYSLFDALVSLYPTYITKVDCDALANESGIETPSYMSGCPIYMYKFIPALTPNASAATESDRDVMKVMIIGGTHPEYTAIMDLWRTMTIICEDWSNDPNIEALRWNVEFYVLPCEGSYVVKSGQRTNYNGVDLNRNMPTGNWKKANSGTSQFSGDSAASEYESKVLIEVYNQIKPNIFIDHHNANISIGKNMVYITSLLQKGVDVGAAHISAMTNRWKSRYSDIMPQDNTIFGFAQFTEGAGTRGGWACEQGALGFTYESNEQIYYESGSNTSKVATIATDGFINFLIRVCKTYSEWMR